MIDSDIDERLNSLIPKGHVESCDCQRCHDVKKLRSKISRLQAIVDRISKTKDGVRVIPGIDVVYHPDFVGCGLVRNGSDAFWACYSRPINECYSTRKAAEAAKGSGK